MISRRRFIAGLAAAGSVLLVGHHRPGHDKGPPSRTTTTTSLVTTTTTTQSFGFGWAWS